jgi:hypothetical protein
LITFEDLNPHDFELTNQQEENLKHLAEKLNPLESAFRKSPGGFIFTFTSGFRSMADHYRIYKNKGIDHPPLGSKHLTGQAVDISDPIGVLNRWVRGDGLKDLEILDLWCEDKTNGWLHMQSVPPHSLNRFFA